MIRRTFTCFVAMVGACLVFILGFGVTSVWAQGTFTISKNADFSTDDRMFDREDTLFMKVEAPDVDFLDIDKNEFELHANSGGGKFEGAFVNGLNTIYTIEVPLNQLDLTDDQWRVEARIRDDSGNEFRVEVEITISGGVSQPKQIVIKGEIETLGLDFLVVKGTKILVDPMTTVIEDQNGNPLTLGELTQGQNVEVRAITLDTGDLLAQRIEVKDRKKGEVQVRGRIDSVGVDHIFVLGTQFFVDANTRIESKEKKDLSISDLVKGQLVEVRAFPQADGTLLATRIKVEEEEEAEVELKGFVEALTDTSITVSGATFKVDSSTRILDDKENPISLSDLAINQLVEIRGIRLSDGSLLATKIKIEDEVPGEDEVEVTGEIKTISEADSEIVVSDITFRVDDNTVIVDDLKRAITFGDLRTGFVVEVKARVQPDGSFLAVRIQIEDRLENEIEFTGTIEAIDVADDTTITISGRTFVVKAQTEILDKKKNPIGFDELSVGQTVEVKAQILVDGTLLALRIKLEGRDRNEIELTGTIETLDLGAQTVKVAGVTFVVGPNTEILDNKKNPISFAQLAVGQLVEVRGEQQPDGTFLANKIKLEDRVEDEVEIRGTIEGLTDTTITVSGLTFNVTDNTVVLDNNKNPIPFANLAVDQFVQVRGELLPGGTLVALRIKLEDNPQNELEVKGSIDSLKMSSVFVLGIEFQVGSTTEILDNKKNPITFGDLVVGQFVEIRAVRQPDGTNLATRIKVEDVSVISGTVSQVASNAVTIFDASLLTDNNTLILGKQNLPITISQISIGQIVEARSVVLDDGSKLATKIKVLSPTSITGIGDATNGTVPPKDFRLSQNYPNPFNPSTSITFELPKSGIESGRVTLVVYNLLGQAVRTLINQPLKSGVYTVQWDGRDDAGRSLASGVYLYQLKAGKIVETKRMLLLK